MISRSGGRFGPSFAARRRIVVTSPVLVDKEAPCPGGRRVIPYIVFGLVGPPATVYALSLSLAGLLS
jgi:hypothetical protein